ncbi:MAG: 2-hydroxy-3-oxopropionate reductase [Rhodoglobus sp.]|nr:2-hydroxy-3-oxopropionate reductase [Rhodoglobus sp.]
MANIVFIGLGIMGKPMALNLLQGGHRLRTSLRRGGTDDDLAAAGMEFFPSIAEAVSGAEVAITMLPDSPDVREVALGAEGIFASASAGLRYLDMSTVDPATARLLAREGEERQIPVLDAPVSGGEAAAVEGKLSVMVGGDARDLQSVLSILELMAATVRHVGAAGAGQTVKAANQLIVAGTIELVAEALVFLESTGVLLEPALEVLEGGLAGSAVLARRGRSMLARNFKPGFRVDLHHKDLGILQEAARDAGVVLPMGALATQLMAALRANGGGAKDHTALLTIVEALSGRSPFPTA